MNTMNPTRYIIRLRGDCAVKFHTNLCGKHYVAVKDAEATVFSDPDVAIQTAIDHGIKAGDIALRHAENQSEVAA